MSTEPTSWQNVPPPIVPSIPLESWQPIDIEALARQQGVEPITDPDVLRGDFWPVEESIDDFLRFLRDSRRDLA